MSRIAVIAVLIFGLACSAIAQTDTLLNLTQWTEAEGGNNHWYGIVAIVQPWVDHRNFAPTLTQNGEPGYLATITSELENAFVQSIIQDYTDQPSVADEFYLGGYYDSAWTWVTLEEWSYTNWDVAEPNGDGPAIAMWGASTGMFGRWNDVVADTAGNDPWHQLWAVIEFGADTTTPTQDTLIALTQWSQTEGGNDHWYGIIPIVQPWIDHRDLAETYVVDLDTGYLATITSQAENEFLKTLITPYTDQPSVADEFFLGGFRDTDGFGWLTDEPFDYTNWATFEPSGDGLALAIWGASTSRFGLWNDVPHDTAGNDPHHQLWALVEFGPPDSTEPPPPPPPEDTLIALAQWTSGTGANNHWYGIIPIVQPWIDHRDLAEMYVLDGDTGYLATVNSADENEFLKGIIAGHTNQPSVADEFYLGGFNDGGFGWITGEPFDYQNWDFGEPNGDGPALAMWGASHPDYGKWNDVPADTAGHGSAHQLWALVEFGSPDFSSDSIFFESVSGSACTDCTSPIRMPVRTLLSRPATAATISLAIPDGVEVCGVNFDGLLTSVWDLNLTVVSNDSGFISVFLGNSTGELIPVDTATLFYVDFVAPTNQAEVRWNTAFDGTSRGLRFADTAFATFVPSFDYGRDVVTLTPPALAPGDVDGDNDVGVGDLTFLIDNIFLGGPAPCFINAADVNGDCSGPDVGDLSYLIAYLFLGGDAPLDGCITSGPRLTPGIAPATIGVDYDGQSTVVRLQSDIPLRGLELILAGDGVAGAQPLTDNLDVISGVTDGGLHLGVIDLDGGEIIAAGSHEIIRLDGQWEIENARASDMSHTVMSIAVGAFESLPRDFALKQNYPNPFNPTTEIEYSVPHPSHVTLSVYNITGQLVSTLVDADREAGNYQVTWRAGDFASGIYLYRLQADGFVETKKMLLLK